MINQKMLDILSMPTVWKPTSVVDEPVTELRRWRVFQVAAVFNADGPPTTHFVGDAGYEGRVSSPILEYDPISRQGRSGSGRIYKLVGNSGYDRDAEHTWNRWQQICKVDKVTNVSERYKDPNTD